MKLPSYPARNHRGYRVGQHHHRAKISDEKVKLLRADRERGLTYGQLRLKYNLPESTVRDIVTYKTRPT